jgi:lipoprotein-releasing system ATP-binding protein
MQTVNIFSRETISMQIIAQALSKIFEQGHVKTEVLKQISCVFSSNSTYALTGVSGSGKSTLMHLLCALDSPTSGTLVFQGENAAQKNFGIIFQDDYLIEYLTVQENVELAGLAKNMPAKTVALAAQELLGKVGLKDKLNAYPNELSGGQRTRAAICRALICKPDFLFAD